jgi:NADPH2:quinone reductase
MKEAIVYPGPEIKIVDTPIPEAGEGQIVTKVVVSGSNPKDWYSSRRPQYLSCPLDFKITDSTRRKVPQWVKDCLVNQGDDIAGYVHSVGKNVTEFKVGDRIAAFHEMLQPGGSYAEYAVSWEYATFHLPSSTSFEEGASIPLAAMTAALGMYQRLALPEPWRPATKNIPLVIWGASAAVGSFALQFAVKSNIHPIIAIAGRAQEHVKQFLDESKGDVVLDYRKGEEAVVKQIKDALKGQKLDYAFDSVSENGSYNAIIKVLEPKGEITLVLPGKKYEEIPESMKWSITSCGSVFKEPVDTDFCYVFFRYLSKGLKDGWFKGHPTEVVPGGLGGIQGALQNLKDGKASAVKYVFRIEETEGVKKSTL